MKLFARDALLPTGWARDIVIDIAGNGEIRSVDVAFATPPDAERVQGALVPGMPNVHSHAFQRALAGLTERGGPRTDDFWTWRTEMYRFLERIGPDEQEAIAMQLYLEMLKAGYTSVGEFHYLHHGPAGKPYANPAEMAERVRAAAAATGMRLTLLPVFYAHGNFGAAPPALGQRRFLSDIDSFAKLFDGCRRAISALQDARIGVAPPTRSNSRSCRTRRSAIWIAADSSPTSSRNRVPPAANSKRPRRRCRAPVNAPLS